MTDIKKIEKIAKVYEQIKKLDSEILQLDKMAMKLAEGVGNLTISISFGEPEKYSGINDTSDIIERLHHSVFSHFQTGGFVGEKKDEGYKETLNEYTSLSLLGVLISEKVQLRNELIKSIEL